MPDTQILITGGRVLGPGHDPHQPAVRDILVEGTTIRTIGAADTPLQAAARASVIDATGKLVVPGFVNAHYHSHDVLLKGRFDTAILEHWILNALPRRYPPRSDEEVRARTLLGAAECLRSGITTVQDMLTLFPLTARQVSIVADAYQQCGLRAVLGLQVANVPPLDTVPFWRQRIPAELHDGIGGPPPPANAPDPVAVMTEVFDTAPPPLVRWALAPSSPERCTRDLLERLADLAERYRLPVVTHIYISRAEALNARRSFPGNGGSLVSLLEDVGLLGPRLSLAHAVWMHPDEMEAVARAGAGVVINPMSNLKTKNGIAPVRQLMEAGVALGIGCDNCSCSDTQNMFQAMKLFTLLAAVSDPAEGRPHAVDALHAATAGGAGLLGLAEETGAIREGMSADLAIIDLDDPVYVPLNSASRQLVYGEGGRGVDTVIAAGRVVVREGRVVSIDEEALRREVAAVLPAFRRDAQAVIESTERLAPYLREADALTWNEDIGLERYARH